MGTTSLTLVCPAAAGGLAEPLYENRGMTNDQWLMTNNQ